MSTITLIEVNNAALPLIAQDPCFGKKLAEAIWTKGASHVTVAARDLQGRTCMDAVVVTDSRRDPNRVTLVIHDVLLPKNKWRRRSRQGN